MSLSHGNKNKTLFTWRIEILLVSQEDFFYKKIKVTAKWKNNNYDT
jgi:hypothetical protein